jgi:hypothetical protein
MTASINGQFDFAVGFQTRIRLWFRDGWPALFLGALILSIGTLEFSRALGVRLPKPEGFKVTRMEAPALLQCWMICVNN